MTTNFTLHDFLHSANVTLAYRYGSSAPIPCTNPKYSLLLQPPPPLTSHPPLATLFLQSLYKSSSQVKQEIRPQNTKIKIRKTEKNFNIFYRYNILTEIWSLFFPHVLNMKHVKSTKGLTSVQVAELLYEYNGILLSFNKKL